jgi:Flp pilus assembly protein TadG
MTRGPKQPRSDQRAARRGRGDGGAALLEFALVGVLLCTLIFGIIGFGEMLSFKQDLTRAAAEGARAGAVAFPSSGAQSKAVAGTNAAVGSFGKSCGAGGLTCTIPVTYDCDGAGAGTANCVSVELSYDYKHNPLIPNLPFVSIFMPDTLKAKSVAEINP